MNKLNDKNEQTKGIIHLMVTSLCNRNCKQCCNKQYDLNSIPYVTEEELKEAHTLCLTGGEPFAFVNPCNFASYYKKHYTNIKNIYVYTNAFELAVWLKEGNELYGIDGLSISIKNITDLHFFEKYILCDNQVNKLNSNLLYVFDNLMPKNVGGFKIINRKWQEEFKPATDSIFRRV